MILYGLANAPSVFHELLHNILKEVLNRYVIICTILNFPTGMSSDQKAHRKLNLEPLVKFLGLIKRGVTKPGLTQSPQHIAQCLLLVH